MPSEILRLIGEEIVASEEPLTVKIRLAGRLEASSKSLQQMVQEVMWPRLLLQAPEVDWEMERDPWYFKDYYANVMSGRPAKELSVMEMWEHFVEHDIDFGKGSVHEEFMRANMGIENAEDLTYQYLNFRRVMSRRRLKGHCQDRNFPLRLFAVQESNRVLSSPSVRCL